jgi:transcriptional regulator with XRE-family HTH domain
MTALLLDAAAKLPDNRAVGQRDARRMLAAIEVGRRQAKLSCEDLARLANISLRAYHRYRANHRTPMPAHLRKLARALGGEDQRVREEALLRALAARALEGLALAIDPKQGRNIAIYLAHVELGLPQRCLARLYGVSGNRINMLVQRIEERREDGTPLDIALITLGQALDKDAGAFLRGAA